MMTQQLQQKVVDPERELIAVQRLYDQLAPQCSVAKHALGIPQLVPQKKQIGILANELKETLLCINLAKKGQHAFRDDNTKIGMQRGIVDLEHMESELRDEKAQQAELDCLNYLASKQIVDMFKKIPTETDELAILHDANNRLRRMNNQLDIATKRFCVVNAENGQVRDEIHRLIVERNNFNILWNREIGKLLKGKEYLMDILEIATIAFGDRDECIRKLEALKWKGLHQLNKDITEMQGIEGDLNHFAKLEEFLRLKSSKRICEADEIDEAKRQEDIAQCEKEIKNYDEALEKIFKYAGSTRVPKIKRMFIKKEKENFSCFILLSRILDKSIELTRDLDAAKEKIFDQRDFNLSREKREDKRISDLTDELELRRKRTQDMQTKINIADETLEMVTNRLQELILLAQCDSTPLLSLLGNHMEITNWNVTKFLRILEMELKSLIEVAYGCEKAKPPKLRLLEEDLKMSQKHKKEMPTTNLIADPTVTQLVPNKIEMLMNYIPCAYCVEDYLLNLVYETPAVPADQGYVDQMLHLEDVNTKFGIYSLTIPSKLHPFRGTNI